MSEDRARHLFAKPGWALALALAFTPFFATYGSPFHDKNGVNDPKWAAYGGPQDAIDTEVQGTVLWIWGGSIYLGVDLGYYHLLLTGNKIKPPPGQYDPTRYPGLDTNWRPLMKLETTAVELRPDANPTGAPFIVQLPGGGSRVLQVGDHISAAGLYAIDYDHSPYSSDNGWTSAYTYARGFNEAAHAASELHPLNMSSLKLVTPGAGPISTELHILHAPIYQDAYTKTNLSNKLSGIRGDLVDESVLTDLAPIADVLPPFSPPGCTNCQVIQSVSTTGTGGTSRITYDEDESINLYMTIHGTDLYNAAMWLTTISTSRFNCANGGCSCKPAPRCIDSTSLPAFCGARINCVGSCNIAPSEPGTKLCDTRFSPDMTCVCE